MKRSKNYNAVAEKVDADKLYGPEEALEFAKSNLHAKFDETVDVSMRLGVDPRKADQMVRGTVNLPNGTGKTARVLVFATGDRAQQALDAGADEVGSDELIDRVAKGYLDFDAVVLIRIRLEGLAHPVQFFVLFLLRVIRRVFLLREGVEQEILDRRLRDTHRFPQPSASIRGQCLIPYSSYQIEVR